MAAITMRGISKSFHGSSAVLRDVNLDIGQNEFCVFLGPSGCGKSTLLRIIAGLEDPSSGELRIGDRVVNAVPPAERGVAMVFQSYALFPHMTVAENIGFGLKLAKTPVIEIERRVRDVADILQLGPLLDRKPKALSGGQRQRVAIGRAIVREPGVFLFDEPLSNLDATLRGQTRVEIARIHKRFNQASTVYVTHDQIEAMTLADRIVLLHAGADAERFGSVAQVGTPLELYYHPNSIFVAGFIGAPRMNFMPVTVTHIDANGVVVTLRDGVKATGSNSGNSGGNSAGEQIRTGMSGANLTIGQSLTLGVRPEHLEVVSDGAPSAFSTVLSIVKRPIALIERLGEQTYLHLNEIDAAPLLAKVQGNSACQIGDLITLGLPLSRCSLFLEDGRAVPHLG